MRFLKTLYSPGSSFLSSKSFFEKSQIQCITNALHWSSLATNQTNMKTIFLFCTLLFCICLNAQIKVISGYYVNTSGDTVKGSFPKYSQWSRNPDRVEFIPAGNSNILQLTPATCLAFSIDNYDDYVSYSGKRLINPIEDDAAINNNGYFFDSKDFDTTITCFLRLVIKTPLCEILVFNDRLRANFFYRLTGQPIQELRFKKYYSDNSLHEMPEYRAQFNNLFSKEISAKNLDKKLENLPYTEEGIENFISELSGGTKSKTKRPARLTIAAGVSINFLDVTGDLSMPEVTSKFNNSFSPFISVGFVLPISRNFNRFFVYPQLRAYNFKNRTNYSTTYSTKVITYQSSLCLLPEVNGGVNIVNRQDFRFFLYGGAGMLFLLKNKELHQSSGSVGYYEIATSKMSYSANVSGGISIKDRFLVMASYHVPVPVANFVAYSVMQSNLQVGIGYKLK